MPRRGPTVVLPQAIAEEIRAAAAQTQRSVAFIVARALTITGEQASALLEGPQEVLCLSCGEDDPPQLAVRLRAASPPQIVASWTASRARFAIWVAREVAARQAEVADDLDEGLRLAADPNTTPAQLLALTASPYVRVRALVAAHPAAPATALERLRTDPDRVVRSALTQRP